jgi:hypothetical protein
MVTVETISIVFTGLSISLAAFYYINTLRNSRMTQEHALETRQAQLYMQLYSFYDNKEFLKDYGNIANVYAYENIEDWNEKYSAAADNEAFSSWVRVGRFFDGVGILTKRGLIDKELIFELLGDVIRGAWQGMNDRTGMERFVLEGRVYWNRPKLWHNFEHLYDELMKYLEEHPELKT